jgi:hypothetical protein
MSVSDSHISRRLRATAMASIDRKCQVLDRWIAKGIPLRGSAELEWFPTSLRTFCGWDGSQNLAEVRGQLDGIQRNAYETLVSDPARLRRVKDVMRAIRKEAERARHRLDPKEAVLAAREQVESERAKRRGALLGYRRARHQAQELTGQLSDEQRAHRETMAQMQGKLRERDEEIVALRRQVAELTASLRKAVPIRPVS